MSIPESRPVGWRGDDSRCHTTEPAWFRRPQGGDQRGVKAVTIKVRYTGPRQAKTSGIHRADSLHGTTDPAVGRQKGRDLIGARDSGDFLRTNRSNPDLYQRQFVIDHACHDTGMAGIILVGIAQVPVRVDLYDGQTGVPLRMRGSRLALPYVRPSGDETFRSRHEAAQCLDPSHRLLVDLAPQVERRESGIPPHSRYDSQRSISS